MTATRFHRPLWAVLLLFAVQPPAPARAQLDDLFGDPFDEESGEDFDEETEAGDDDEADDDEVDESDSETLATPDVEEEAPAPGTGTAVTSPGLQVRIAAGAGVGFRGLRKPRSDAGAQVLADQAYAAVDLGLDAHFNPEGAVGLWAGLRFQTSIGEFEIQDTPPLSAGTRTPARSERVELALGPTIRLDDGPRAVSLAVAVGGAMRSLWHSRHETTIPRYSLAGLMARPQLIIPFGPGLRLRAGPEVQWFFVVDRLLARDGVDGEVLGIAVDAAVGWQFTADLAVEVTYREGYATASGAPINFEDTERYLTARMVGTL